MEELALSKAVSENRDAIQKVEKISGVKLSDCYQCGKCTAGCPVEFAMDVAPRRIIRMLQLGMLEEALQTKTIWMCATCQTCVTRCPKEVDLPSLMENLRMIAKERGIKSVKESDIFHELFLKNVKLFGKNYELGLVGFYNLMSGNLMQDAWSGPHYFRHGKISVLPHTVKDKESIKKIFKKCLERGDHS